MTTFVSGAEEEKRRSTDYKSNALVQRRINTQSCLSIGLINLVLAMRFPMVKLWLFLYLSILISL